jgi:hypothetical protein
MMMMGLQWGSRPVDDQSVVSLCCFGRFGQGSAYAPVLFLRARVGCPDVSPSVLTTGVFLSLFTVGWAKSVILVAVK